MLISQPSTTVLVRLLLMFGGKEVFFMSSVCKCLVSVNCSGILSSTCGGTKKKRLDEEVFL